MIIKILIGLLFIIRFYVLGSFTDASMIYLRKLSLRLNALAL